MLNEFLTVAICPHGELLRSAQATKRTLHRNIPVHWATATIPNAPHLPQWQSALTVNQPRCYGDQTHLPRLSFHQLRWLVLQVLYLPIWVEQWVVQHVRHRGRQPLASHEMSASSSSVFYSPGGHR